eukprot:CAMPEP_0183722918 /NCGR_PEP_ID=MMETSP0737-20130205/14722_1 /TAXON_ID=385413 /ORGANISM="Thalassiosira miniscula, Strain CCMP1093" /LENGTH=584 /DNA_ID=CAMNT_0025953165 /DNA_START=433 /DNA_END=2187 /DNA_ORIENTATION=+
MAGAKAKSWIDIPSDCDFSIDNIPFGVCSFPKKKGDTHSNASTSPLSFVSLAPSIPRCCTAIGKFAVDLHVLANAGLLDDLKKVAPSTGTDGSNSNKEVILINFHPRLVFSQPSLNDFMSHDKQTWKAVRDRLIALFLLENETHPRGILPDDRLQRNDELQHYALCPLVDAMYHLPAVIGDYTDFYSSREHATNVGIMFRGKDNALQPNWLHMPIGYHGRSSSVLPSLAHDATPSKGKEEDDKEDDETSMTYIRRPCGQLQIDPSHPKKGSTYGPCKKMDFELEVAFFVGGTSNTIGEPLTTTNAKDRIFGYVLMNDWSARDVQKWEYVPLGPFTSKNFATTISTWVVTPMALEPYRCETSAGTQGGGVAGKDDPLPLEYLQDPDYGSYDVNLTVSLQPKGASKPTQLCQSNLKHTYWTSTQQLVHHSVTGCPMNAGDLLASGTISGKERHNFGSMLELSWGGSKEIVLENENGDEHEVRKFLEDGDAIIMKGWCEKEGMGRVGFGQCSGRVLPAIPFPYKSEIMDDAKPTQQNVMQDESKCYEEEYQKLQKELDLLEMRKGILSREMALMQDNLVEVQKKQKE